MMTLTPQTANPWQPSRTLTSSAVAPSTRRRIRPAMYPPAMKLDTVVQSIHSPTAVMANVAPIPSPWYGEIEPKPIAVPKEEKTKAMAVATTAPAAIAAQSV